jgi:hypothetical protein
MGVGPAVMCRYARTENADWDPTKDTSASPFASCERRYSWPRLSLRSRLPDTAGAKTGSQL